MKRKALKPVHPNAGIEAEYRAKLDRLVREMSASYTYFLKAQYRETPPELAMDDAREREMHRRSRQREQTHRDRLFGERRGRTTAAEELRRELSILGKRWQKRIDEAAPKLARWFTQASHRRSQESLKKILRDGGISVEFKMTREMRDVADATVQENVSLIRSIASKYHSDVEGLVMRSVTTGRDLKQLTDDLEDRFGVTRRRAAHIALDQNNKATSAFVRVRQVDLGLKAKWLHSHGGKEPRKTHLANSGKVYDPAKGWFDPDPRVRRHIWPGELINCRCVSVSIVEGFS